MHHISSATVMPITLESLPVELITAILEELDLASLVIVSSLSRRLHSIASDRSLNPWRTPILRNLHSGTYERSLRHLSVRTTVPRQNWIEISAGLNLVSCCSKPRSQTLKRQTGKSVFEGASCPDGRNGKENRVGMKLSRSTCTPPPSGSQYVDP
jgi:hypothetical protein